MRLDHQLAVTGTALNTRHIPPLESEGERQVRIHAASQRVADGFSISLKRARLLVRYSSVRVRA